MGLRGYKTDEKSVHSIIRYLLISKLGISPSEIDKMAMSDIHKLIIIHLEVLKIEKENQDNRGV